MDPTHDVRAAYDALAETYLDSRDPPARERALLEAFAATLPAGGRVLDAGCGAGVPAMARLAADASTAGLDVARAQLELARERVPSADLVHGELSRLPFEEGVFDGVVSLHAVTHVPRDDHAAVLREFRRVLALGGRLLVTLGASTWEGENPDWLDTGVSMQWSYHGRERSLAMVRDAGFAVAHDEMVADELGDGGALFVHADAT